MTARLTRWVAEGAFAAEDLFETIAVPEIPRVTRLVRSLVLTIREEPYVEAAISMGTGTAAIMRRHVLPNPVAPLIVQGTFICAAGILTEAILSVLGVGGPPTQPSLGTLIRIGNDFLFSGEWWITIFPGIMLVLIALSVNLLGDWLRDALNPRLR